MRHYGEGVDAYTQFFLAVDGNSQADMTVFLRNGWFDFNPATAT